MHISDSNQTGVWRLTVAFPEDALLPDASSIGEWIQEALDECAIEGAVINVEPIA